MIVFLSLLYVVLLQMLVWLKVIKWTKLWGLSILVWVLLLTFVLFIPMQFGAPRGDVVVLRRTIPIVPRVSGEVIDVPVTPNTPLEAGDVLFRIDPVPFQAQVDALQAQLDLARTRMDQSTQLAESDAGSVYEVQSYEAQVRQLEANLVLATYNLDATVVRAPSDGMVTNLGLATGARAVALPLSPAMAFVSAKPIIGVQVPEAYIRHVKVDQTVELVFKMRPGHVYSARVESLVPANAAGQLSASGAVAAPRVVRPGAFFVRVELEDEELADLLPTGAVGQAAIYTEAVKATHIIRRVMIRMKTWTDYIIPS